MDEIRGLWLSGVKFTFPERGGCGTLTRTSLMNSPKNKLSILKAGKSHWNAPLLLGRSGVSAPCVSTVVPDRAASAVRSEFIKLCLIHAFRAIRVGELFEIRFPLMNGSAQLSVTIRLPRHTRLSWRLLPAEGSRARGTGTRPGGNSVLPKDDGYFLRTSSLLLKSWEVTACPAGMNSGESRVLRTLKSCQLGLSSCPF